MKLDETDVYVLQSIFNKKDTTHWEIAKSYGKLIGLKNRKEIDNLYRTIKFRLNSFCKIGIFCEVKNGNGDMCYVLKEDKIKFGKHKFGNNLQNCLILKMPL